MADLLVDADGYTKKIRRSIVEKAMANVRAKNIEPDPAVLAIYEQYISGSLSRQETSSLMIIRLQEIHNRLVIVEGQRGNY